MRPIVAQYHHTMLFTQFVANRICVRPFWSMQTILFVFYPTWRPFQDQRMWSSWVIMSGYSEMGWRWNRKIYWSKSMEHSNTHTHTNRQSTAIELMCIYTYIRQPISTHTHKPSNTQVTDHFVGEFRTMPQWNLFSATNKNYIQKQKNQKA